MKRVLILLMLTSICQVAFSLEVAYMKPIVVWGGYSDRVVFCDDAQNIIFGSIVIDVQDGTKTRFNHGREWFLQLNRFAYSYKEDKFGRKQRTLFSFEHGKKLISNEVCESLKNHIRDDESYSPDYWWLNLYGNSGVHISDMIYIVDGGYFGLEFFSDNNQTIELPIEMKYAVSGGSIGKIGLSYDLFTGAFYQMVYYDGIEAAKYTELLHIFNIIYDGKIVVKTEIRETPSYDGKILGYLNEGEGVKVSKAENYEKREEYQDYWYYVTTDSYSGWCTGKFLLIEGGTWQERLELRGLYVEWDEIPESEDITKTPLYGVITVDTKLYDELPDKNSLPRKGVLEILEASPSSGVVQKERVVEVIDQIVYTEDFSGGRSQLYGYYKIRLEDGTEGWVVRKDIDLDFDGTEIVEFLRFGSLVGMPWLGAVEGYVGVIAGNKRQ